MWLFELSVLYHLTCASISTVNDVTRIDFLNYIELWYYTKCKVRVIASSSCYVIAMIELTEVVDGAVATQRRYRGAPMGG